MKTLQEYLNESKSDMIDIISVKTSGDSNISLKGKKINNDTIVKMLKNPDSITDDDIFYDSNGKSYTIDDLEGRQVRYQKQIFQL